MMKMNLQKQKTASNRLNAGRWTANRVIAMALCASMALSSFSYLMTPTQASTGQSGNNFKDLYIRQADKNTMDSYVQASLGGFIYTGADNMDAVTTPTVRNNYGTRFAGEVWADLSVFAQYQPVIAEIRPFEAGHVYSDTKLVSSAYSTGQVTELQRALDTLTYYGIDYKTPGYDLVTALKGGTLTSSQASALNNAVNNARTHRSYGSDGDFDGNTLTLERHTDGVNSFITMDENTDFLEVFSALGSSEMVNENALLPIDVVFVLDTSSTMVYSSGDYYRLAKAANALNQAMKTVMKNDLNRVALVTYDTNAEIRLPLDYYEPIEDRVNFYDADNDGKPDFDTTNNISMEYHSCYDRAQPVDDLIIFDSRIDTSLRVYPEDHADKVYPDSDPAFDKNPVPPPDDGVARTSMKDLFDLDYGANMAVYNPKYLVDHLADNKSYYHYTFDFIQLNLRSKTNPEKEYTTWINAHSGTNTHQGLYEGLKILFEQGQEGEGRETETKVQINGVEQTLQRVPVVILISDGAPSFVTSTDPYSSRGSGNNVLYTPDTNPYIEYQSANQKKYDDYIASYESNPAVNQDPLKRDILYRGLIDGWWEPKNTEFVFPTASERERLIGYPSFSGWGNALPVYFMASYMKQQVNEAYFDSPSPTQYGTQIITVGVDSTSTWDPREVGLMYTTLNPGEWLSYESYKKSLEVHEQYTDEDGDDCLLWDAGSNKVTDEARKIDNFKDIKKHNFSESDAAGKEDARYAYVKMLYEFVDSYLKKEDISDIRLDIDEWSQYATMVRASDPNVEAAIQAAGWEGIYYNDDFVDTDADQLASALQSIINGLRYVGEIFNPISGTNASGVRDSLTYQNPIGEYMQVDDVTDITMFGEHYQVGKRAVYDYSVNEKILETEGNRQERNPDLIKEGWYSEEAGADGTITYSYLGPTPPYNLTAEQAWEKGYVFRITYATAQQYVPTLAEGDEDASKEDSLTDKQKNTTYTLYTITGQYEKNSDGWTVKTETANGAVKKVLDQSKQIKEGDENKDARTRYNLSYVDNEGNKTVKFDLLEDIKMWVEDTGSFKDSSVGDTVLNAGYKEALFINVSTTALPLQVATIDKDPLVNTITYSTNLNDTPASTPLRVYFEVSLDPAYLRYASEGAAKAQDKSQAVGVAMTKMDGNYLTANTGENFYGVASGRYTAFYSNYFSDTRYKGYPVVTDQENKESRGDPVVTFSPSLENQFYLFQKNRVLFLIPGTYGLADRPAEIDLGDLSATWLDPADKDNVYTQSARGNVTIYTDKRGNAYEQKELIEGKDKTEAKIEVEGKTVTLEQADPTYYEDLLTILNNARETSGKDGAPSTYWWFGDCIAVDGGSDVSVANIKKVYAERTQKKISEGKLSADEVKEGGSLAARYDAFIAALGQDYQPQIDSSGWYYIIREFYYPIFADSETGDGKTAETVELHYMAVARKGSEFGSGLANDQGMGAMLEWYNPETGEPRDSFSPAADSHYGYPPVLDHPKGTNEEKGLKYNADGSHSHTGDWYVSAKPGGLRVGGMANFAGVKGYDIREGVDQGEFAKNPDVVQAANVTERAKTYFLPAVSSYAPSSQNRASADVVINIFLGNEGRILAQQNLLLVTKMAFDAENNPVFDSTQFSYKVTIDDPGFNGEREAAVVIWTGSAWRRMIGEIRAENDNDGLLYKTKSLDTLASFIGDNNNTYGAARGQKYYIYPDSGEVMYRTEDGSAVDKGAKNEVSVNEIEFFASVWLVPAGKYSDRWSFPEGKKTEAAKIAAEETADADGYIHVSEFPIATMKANADSDEIALNSGYNIDFSYVSRKLNFTNGETEFTLESGEGLLFNNIRDNANYTVTENLGGLDEKWRFQSVSVNGNTMLENNAGVTVNGRAYTVSGTVNVGETKVDYVNFTPEAHIELRGIKTLVSTPPNAGNAKLKAGQFTFKLTPGDFTDTPNGTSKGTSPMPENAATTNKAAKAADSNEAEFTFKQITFKEAGYYTYTITEEPDTVKGADGQPVPGYTYDDEKVYKVTVEVTGDPVVGLKARVYSVEPTPQKADVDFTNYYNEPVNLTISKTVMGSLAEPDKDFVFTVTLTAPTGVTLLGEYDCTMTNPDRDDKVQVDTASGNVTLAGSKITLTHGQSITIKGLPAGTTYTVVEDDYSKDGYTTFVDGVSAGIITEDTEVGFTNSKPEGGSVIIQKDVTGEKVPADKDFTFTVTITDGGGTSLAGPYPYYRGASTDPEDKIANGSGTIKLTAGETVQIEGLPEGAKVTVTEEIPEGFGMEVVAEGGGPVYVDGGVTVTIPAADGNGRIPSVRAVFTNHWKTGDLTVKKTVVGGDSEKQFHFTVELSDKTISGEYGGMTFDNGVAKFVLTNGESRTAEGLPSGITYEVTEEEADQDGYITSVKDDSNWTIPVDEEATVEFVNTKNAGSLTVSKTVTGKDGDKTKDFTFTVTLDDTSINGEYGGMIFDNGVATFTLKHGESKTATGLPAGISYRVTESDNAGYTVSATDAAGTIVTNVTKTAAFENNKGDEEDQTGGLTVIKTVAGKDGDKTKDFTFTVTLKDDSITGEYGDMTFTKGVATFTLKHGQSKTATGLPAGVEYTVTEDEADSDGYTTTSTDADGTIPKDGEAVVTFVNKKGEDLPGDLTVSKTVTGKDGDTTKQFTFTVKLNNLNITGTYGDMTFTNGVATFTLKHGESKTATGLPDGTFYEVIESDNAGYTVSSTGATGIIPSEDKITAAFENTKSAGALTVSKTVTGNKGDTTKEFTFTVTLSDKTVNGEYGDMTFVNGVAVFKLKHGQSKTAAGLPAGITYTVTETEANQDSYTTTATGDTGTIPDGGTAEAAFVNGKNDTPPDPGVGSLAVSKTVSGNTGERNKLFHFTVTLSDKTINGIYGDVTFVNGSASFTLKHGETKTVRNLPDGVTYTVTETEANQDGYTTSATGARGTIAEGWRNLVSFMNYRENPDTPKTGDESRFVLWLAMLGLSLTGLLISLVYTIGSSVPVGARGGKRLVGRKGKRLKR